MTKAAAIYQFWSGFGLTAYEENTVPDDATFPYITYQLVTDSFDREIPLTASLWYRSESWTGINAKTEEQKKLLNLTDTLVYGRFDCTKLNNNQKVWHNPKSLELWDFLMLCKSGM